MNALDNLIEELQEALKKDPAMAFDVYKCAGVSADRPKKRSARFLEVSSKRDELEALKKELDETRKELNSVEKACINKINSIAKKRKNEISVQLRQLEERQKSIDREIKNFQVALLETEYRSLDWLKRVDKREIQAFEEIRNNIDDFNVSNASPTQEGFIFEKDFAKALEKNGFLNIQVTEKSGDFGADILAEKDGVKYVIQCKYYSSAVGIEAVQQIYAAKIYYSSHVAVVATNSVFTKAAKILAEETGVLLWNGKKVQEMTGI